MKNLNIYICLIFLIGTLACEPIEDRDELGAPVKELKYTVTQDPTLDYKIYLRNETPGTIPLWEFLGAKSTMSIDTFEVPFAQKYMIKFSAYGRGGVSHRDSTEITVTKNNPDYFKEPQWKWLTNGEAGKTWKLDMSKPQGWYGLDFGKASGANWSWHPDYQGNEWLMENKDWGQMTFDLKGGFGYSRTMYDANKNPIKCNGQFSLDLKAGTIKLNGCEMLYGGTRSNFGDITNLKILSFEENVLILGVMSSAKPEYYGFRFIPK